MIQISSIVLFCLASMDIRMNQVIVIDGHEIETLHFGLFREKRQSSRMRKKHAGQSVEHKELNEYETDILSLNENISNSQENLDLYNHTNRKTTSTLPGTFSDSIVQHLRHRK